MPMLEHKECTVEPGCSYEIFVETSDRKIQQTINYTVPGNAKKKKKFHLNLIKLK